MNPVEVNGRSYSIGKLDAFKQFHVARRLAPLVQSIGSAMLAAKNSDNQLERFKPVLDLLAKMSDEDVEYILGACLNVVTRKQPDGGFARVRANGTMMFDDITVADMMTLTMAVVEENGLLDFFLDAPTPTSATTPATA